MRKAVVYLGVRRPAAERFQSLMAAHRAGYDILLLDDHPADDHVLDHIADIKLAPRDDFDANCRIIDDWRTRYDIRGVINWHDITSVLRADLCTAYGWPGMTREAALASFDKGVMRTALASTCPQYLPGFAIMGEDQDADALSEKLKAPLILKPASATGSKGVVEILDDRDIPAALVQLRQMMRESSDPHFEGEAHPILAEERMVGREVSLDGLIIGNKPHFFDIVDFRSSPVFHLDYYNIYPSNLPLDEKENVYVAAGEILAALGYRNCAFHLEGILTTDGFKLLEVAARPGAGAIASHSVPTVFGIDYLGDYVRCACGDEPSPRLAGPRQHIGYYCVLADEAGHFHAMTGLEELIKYPGVELLCFDTSPPADIALPPDDYASPRTLFFLVGGRDYAHVERQLEKAAALVRPSISKN